MDNDVKRIRDVIKNMERVILGKKNVIELIMVTLLCKGHILIEDVPGVGKTMLASSLAKSIKASSLSQ